MGWWTKTRNAVTKPFKQIGKGAKKILHSATKAIRKALKSPIVKVIALAAAAYFLTPAIAGMLTGPGGMFVSGTVAADVATGALTGAVINGSVAAIDGKSVGGAMAKGGLMGGATAGVSGAFGQHASSLGKAAGSVGSDTTGQTAGVSGAPQVQATPNASGLAARTPAYNAANAGAQAANSGASSAAANAGATVPPPDSASFIPDWMNTKGGAALAQGAARGAMDAGGAVLTAMGQKDAQKAQNEADRLAFERQKQEQARIFANGQYQYTPSAPQVQQATSTPYQLAQIREPLYRNSLMVNPSGGLSNQRAGFLDPTLQQNRTVV